MKTLKTGVVTKIENGKIMVHSPYFYESSYYARKSKTDAGKAFIIAFIGLVIIAITLKIIELFNLI